jgi:acyl-CoA synthetase (AMP-forming)/AMP-acid ligase II
VSDLISAAPLLDASPLGDLSRFGDRPALITRDATLSYLELAARVRETAEALGATRRLVMVTATNTVDAAVAYLAALSGGHPVLLLPPDPSGHAGSVLAAYDPDVMFRDGAAGWELVERREGTAHDLHPDLALLLSTSGSTGSPKLVRLSRENVRSNAESIASALGIQGSDRAATTLPIHYCYGLSVINSHLLSGAGLILTDLSVLDSCFWDLFGSAGGTTFAGVPYTFDLLEQCGFADQDLPSLRYVTQAGGRLDPERVAYWAGLGRRRGWDLYVMYGQTEATARMAILPPDLALEHPEAIGVPVPGGSFRLDPETGELLYRGANVMMGYAGGPADLAEGPGVHELRTGDLARRLDGGIYEIVGRCSRFAKIFGLRVDLDQLERVLGEHGIVARCVEQDGRIHAFVTRHADAGPARSLLAAQCGLPLHAVRAAQVQEHPTTATGKADYAALERQAELLGRDAVPVARRGPASARELRDLYAELLGRPDATEDSSFVSLSGDSLSYVEVSVRLADRLGTLPRAWHTMPPRELARPSGTTTGRWGSLLETTVLLRAVAILLIVGTHTELFTLYGGAHILLGVAGYNFARFQLGEQSRGALTRRGLGALGQVAVPSMLWIAGVGVLTGMYVPATAVFLNGALGSDTWTVQWQFWFLEALVWSVLASVALLAVPQLYRLERRAPWEFALGVLGVGLALRFALVGIQAGPLERYSVPVVFWFFALGWAAAKASGHRQRFVVTLVALLSVPGFFGSSAREALVVAGFLLLLWLPGVHAPRAFNKVAAAVAGASLYIYLTHWQVYPHLEVDHPFLAVVASVLVGLGVERCARPLLRRLGRIESHRATRSRS